MLKKCLSLLPLRANQQLFTSRHVYAPCFHLFNKHKIFTTQQQQCLFTATRFLKQEEIQEEIEHERVTIGSQPENLTPPPKDIFAIVHIGGKQHKVTIGDFLITERLPLDIGTKISLDKVLLVGGKNFTAIGRPVVQNAKVFAIVEEQTRSRRVIVFKKRRRKRWKKWRTHQQMITVLRIEDIEFEIPKSDPAEEKVVAVE